MDGLQKKSVAGRGRSSENWREGRKIERKKERRRKQAKLERNGNGGRGAHTQIGQLGDVAEMTLNRDRQTRVADEESWEGVEGLSRQWGGGCLNKRGAWNGQEGHREGETEAGRGAKGKRGQKNGRR